MPFFSSCAPIRYDIWDLNGDSSLALKLVSDFELTKSSKRTIYFCVVLPTLRSSWRAPARNYM